MPIPHIWNSMNATTAQRELFCAAHWIWQRRGTAKTAGFSFSEETITETVLLDIATALPHQLKVIPFNKHEEGKSGADWEWCFYDHSKKRYLRFLMQAKLLDNKDQLYAHIDRFIGNSGIRQIDRLRETASARGVPALYAFYNHLSDFSRVPVRTCDCHACLECWGASVATADSIFDLLPDKSFEKIKHVSIPWMCLLCSAGNDAGDTIDKVISAFELLERRAITSGLDRGVMPSKFQPRIEAEPPNYFYDIPESMREAEMEPIFREKLAAANPGVDGVILVDSAQLDPPDPDFYDGLPDYD